MGDMGPVLDASKSFDTTALDTPYGRVGGALRARDLGGVHIGLTSTLSAQTVLQKLAAPAKHVRICG